MTKRISIIVILIMVRKTIIVSRRGDDHTYNKFLQICILSKSLQQSDSRDWRDHNLTKLDVEPHQQYLHRLLHGQTHWVLIYCEVAYRAYHWTQMRDLSPHIEHATELKWGTPIPMYNTTLGSHEGPQSAYITHFWTRMRGHSPHGLNNTLLGSNDGPQSPYTTHYRTQMRGLRLQVQHTTGL